MEMTVFTKMAVENDPEGYIDNVKEVYDKILVYDYAVNGMVINNSVAMIIAEETAALICCMAIVSQSSN